MIEIEDPEAGPARPPDHPDRPERRTAGRSQPLRGTGTLAIRNHLHSWTGGTGRGGIRPAAAIVQSAGLRPRRNAGPVRDTRRIEALTGTFAAVFFRLFDVGRDVGVHRTQYGGVIFLRLFGRSVGEKLHFQRLALFDGAGEQGPRNDSFGYEFEFRIGGSQHRRSIRYGSNIGDEVETFAKTRFAVERSNRNSEFLTNAVRTDQQYLA